MPMTGSPAGGAHPEGQPTGPVVFLDPFDVLDGAGWVIVRWPTGVRHQQQYGGTATRQGELEGYLVPVDLSRVAAELHELFVIELKGAGLSRPRSPLVDEVLPRLAALVGQVTMAASIGAVGQEAALAFGPGPLRRGR